MGVTAAIVVGTVAAGYAVDSSERAKQTAKDQTDKQNRDLENLQNQAKEQEVLSDEQGKQQAARARQKVMAANAGGRRSTILTSPLGVQGGAPEQASKTLLGQ